MIKKSTNETQTHWPFLKMFIIGNKYQEEM